MTINARLSKIVDVRASKGCKNIKSALKQGRHIEFCSIVTCCLEKTEGLLLGVTLPFRESCKGGLVHFKEL